MCSRVNRTFIDTASTARSVAGVPKSPASLLKRAAKIALAELTPLKIPLAGLGVALLAMGLPVFPAAALVVTMTMSDGDSNGAGANWTATVCYDTANRFEFVAEPFFIRYFPAKMTFNLEPNPTNPLVGAGGTVVHEEVRLIFTTQPNEPDKSNFTVTNDTPGGWDGTLNGRPVSNVILKMNSSDETKFVSFNLDGAFEFNPISFDFPSGDFLGGANYTFADTNTEGQGFDGTFYSFVTGEPCEPDPEPDPGPVDIDIDIKPGSFPNSINLGSGGATPVAILGSATFDVNNIDETTLTLGTAGIKTVGKTDPHLLCSIEDVSGEFVIAGPEGAPDDFDDLVCHFITVGIVPEAGDTEAKISGDLLDGTPIEGTDSVNIVP